MYILDTGPIFKFLATHCTAELIAALGGNTIHVPAAVEREILSTPERYPQFMPAIREWGDLRPNFKKVLDDHGSEHLDRHCLRVMRRPLDEVYAHPRDLGETMAVLHGLVAAEHGAEVVIACDDGAGKELIVRQQKFINLMRVRGRCKGCGSIRHVDTLELLRWAIAADGGFTDKARFRAKYREMANLDSALPPDLNDTDLMKRSLWSS